MTATVDTVLVQWQVQILDEAYGALGRSRVQSYDDAGEQFTRLALANLFGHVVDALRTRELDRIVTPSARIAGERFHAGFGIGEVQTAFNALEEAMWRRLVSVEPPDDLVEAVGLLGTVLGAGKDSLSREYVSLASRRHVPSLDLVALFDGTTS